MYGFVVEDRRLGLVSSATQVVKRGSEGLIHRYLALRALIEDIGRSCWHLYAGKDRERRAIVVDAVGRDTAVVGLGVF